MTDYKVVKAENAHIKDLQRFTQQMCEQALIAFPNMDIPKSTRVAMQMIKDETALCLIKDKKVVGAVAGMIIKWVFSESEYLSEMGFWIDKEHRTVETATMLLNKFKDIADRKMIPCILNPRDGKEIEKRNKFFEINGFRKIGETYGYGL